MCAYEIEIIAWFDNFPSFFCNRTHEKMKVTRWLLKTQYPIHRHSFITNRAYSLSSEQIELVRRKMNVLDKDTDGFLSLTELENMICEEFQCKMPLAYIQSVLSSLDNNKDKRVDFMV
jgi:hypothetical protein